MACFFQTTTANIFGIFLLHQLVSVASGTTSSTCAWGCGRRWKHEGKTEPEFRLLGGEDADITEWPWAFSLRITTSCKEKQTVFFCSAQLIGKKHLITSAHCLFQDVYESGCLEHPSSTKRTVWIVLQADAVKAVHNGVEYKVVGLKSPEFFNENAQNHSRVYDADIAVLELENAIEKFTSELYPICLARLFNREEEPESGTVVGFGASKLDEVANAEEERKPKSIEAKIAEAELCELQWGLSAQLCAGSSKKGGMSGDSGSAIIVEHHGVYFALGILSMVCEKLEARDRIPDVYVLIPSYCGWIYKATGKQVCCQNQYNVPVECRKSEKKGLYREDITSEDIDDVGMGFEEPNMDAEGPPYQN